MTEQTLSLGARLKATRDASAEEKARADLARRTAESEQARRELETVKQFFEQAKTTFTQRILGGMDAGKVSMHRTPVESVLKTYTWHKGMTIASVQHQYYPVWQDFAAWAKENGLQPKLVSEHDGGGIEGWYVLQVNPL